jgi:hypothetical protein
MTVIFDTARRVHTNVTTCRSCGAQIYWSLTSKGKRAPFNVDAAGEATRESHFATCPNAEQWRKPKS